MGIAAASLSVGDDPAQRTHALTRLTSSHGTQPQYTIGARRAAVWVAF